MTSPDVDKQGFLLNLAEQLKAGHTFLTADIGGMIVNYGYRESSVNDVIINVRSSQILEEAGVELVVDQHRKTRIYRDGKLPLENTDIETTKQRIDAIERERVKKILQTKREG